MIKRMPIYIGKKAVHESILFSQSLNKEKYLLVADSNTQRVLGQQVAHAFTGQGWDVLTVVLDSEGLIADDCAVMQVLKEYDGRGRIFLAVGSGTITDITRFTSQRTRNVFLSFPTAASVDAYTSVNASITIGKLKRSIVCSPPIAIFADLAVISAAPKRLTASGFGDLCAKFTSTADWKLSHVLWDADFDEQIYQSGLQAARSVAAQVEAIADGEENGMREMIKAQFTSGFCMADFGRSDPASGLEHHIAHVWEMQAHWRGQHSFLHGEAVAAAVLHAAGLCEKLRALDITAAARMLDATVIPARSEQEQHIRTHLAPIAETLIAQKPIYWQLADPQVFGRIKERILDEWDAIQEIAAQVPPAESLRDWFVQVGTPITPQQIGVNGADAQLGWHYAHYLRERFSTGILAKLFGLN